MHDRDMANLGSSMDESVMSKFQQQVVYRQTQVNNFTCISNLHSITAGSILQADEKIKITDDKPEKVKHEFHETCHSVAFYFIKKDSKRCYNTTMPESIHTKDESKRSSAFAFIFGVN